VKKSRSIVDVYEKDKFLTRLMQAIFSKDEHKLCVKILRSNFEKFVKNGSENHDFDQKLLQKENFQQQIEEMRIFSEE
jgi:hypothetical protein